MDKNNIFVSVIIPVYNGEDSIANCLEKIIDQSLKEIEVICIDDGSSDKSAEMINKFSQRDDRIILIQQSNQGSGAARNAGINAASGEYVAFMDADDSYPSYDTLMHMYSKAKANNALICGGSFMTDNGTVCEKKFTGGMSECTFTKEGWIEYKNYQFDYSFYRFLYNRKLLVENCIYFPNYRRYQDPPFMMRAFSAAGRFYAIPEITYCYRKDDSHVNWTVDKVVDLLSAIEDNLIFSLQKGYKNAYTLNYNRLCNQFCNTIVEVAIKSDTEGKIIRKLLEIQCFVNPQLLKGDNYSVTRAYICSKPLDKLITLLSNQNRNVTELNAIRTQIRDEGWFINKKIFRIYTWPVRAIGKGLRSHKHKHKK